MPLILILIFLILLEAKISQLKVTAMTFDINYPEPPEFYIAWSGEGESLIISYGYVESHRSLTTGLDNIETFTEEAPYLARLLEFGINPNEEEVTA